jgi:hypothetical protein
VQNVQKQSLECPLSVLRLQIEMNSPYTPSSRFASILFTVFFLSCLLFFLFYSLFYTNYIFSCTLMFFRHFLFGSAMSSLTCDQLWSCLDHLQNLRNFMFIFIGNYTKYKGH